MPENAIITDKRLSKIDLPTRLEAKQEVYTMSIATTCKYSTCDRPRDVKNRSLWCGGHRFRWSKKMDMDKPFQVHRKGLSAYENVMSQTERQGDCLIFTGFIATNGYGRVDTKETGEIYAHRAVAQHHLGKSDKIVLHACDNPRCVEINHLSYGSHLDNAKDRTERMRSAFGEKNGKSYLKQEDVLKIFNDHRASRIVAEEYGCASKTVRNIRNGTTWSWLTNKTPA